MDNQQVSYLEVYKQHTTHQIIEVTESGVIRKVSIQSPNSNPLKYVEGINGTIFGVCMT